MKETKYKVKGMHCVSCEILLEKELKKSIPFQKCKINHKTGDILITAKKEPDEHLVEKAVEACGYKMDDGSESSHDNDEKNTLEDYVNIGLIALLLGFIIFFLSIINIHRLFPSVGNDVNIVVALILGVAASLSTCLALTGGIVMSFGEMVKVEDDKRHPFISKALPHLYFHAGRIGGFALLGGLLGLIGSKINYSLSFTGYLTILIAVVMIYIGLQILNLVPNITKVGFHLPKFLSKPLHSLQNNDHHLTPILIGALTFFLPCGFTQSMQLAAVASGSFAQGALMMTAFAVGTAPVLLSIGIGSTYAKKGHMKLVNQFIGVLVIFFAVYSLNSGLVLAGSNFTLTGFFSSKSAVESVQQDGDVQVVEMAVDWTFKPNEFRIEKGVPVRWEIEGVNVSGCSNEIVIPSLGISKPISKGMNVIEFTPTESGTIPFSCWMGMLGGRFIVE